MNTKPKRCCRCGLVKPLSEFHNRFETRDGHNYHCRMCESKSYYRRKTQKALESWKSYDCDDGWDDDFTDNWW